ncbi:hypothetical protein D9Q98_005780 [Chlorella vulgaris]|uniref:Uncharacterized protein n=1 Tax=Chlorella vulgaris TaxID=3077 RepID=A0A9D4TMX2_CHLVU|nr:hypothetical protein D9Q98_005780 [Chlorella vulgaris]
MPPRTGDGEGTGGAAGRCWMLIAFTPAPGPAPMPEVELSRLERKHDLLTVMAGMSPVAHVSYGSQVLGTLLAAARAVGGGNGPASSKAERWPLACLRGPA